MNKKAWKSIYDDLGGNPQNTSAATCTRRHYEKFLLPYERHTKGQEEKEIKRRESESGSEKSTSSLDTKLDRLKSETEDNQSKSDDNLSEQDTTTKQESTITTNAKKVDSESDATNIATTPASCATPTSDAESSKKSESSSLAGAGPHPLLDQVKSLIGTSKPDREMKIDPEGKQLQIDDLIIIPNNLAATPPEGGSALQNLAKIASRYQNQKAGPEESGSGNSSQEASAAKKAKIRRVNQPGYALEQTSPSGCHALGSINVGCGIFSSFIGSLGSYEPGSCNEPRPTTKLIIHVTPWPFHASFKGHAFRRSGYPATAAFI